MSSILAVQLAERISQKIQDTIDLDIDIPVLSAEEILRSVDVDEFLRTIKDLEIDTEVVYRSSFEDLKADRVALALSDKLARNQDYFFKRNREIEVPFSLKIKKYKDFSMYVSFEVESKLGNSEIFMVNRHFSDDVERLMGDDFIDSRYHRQSYESLFECSTCEVLSKIIEEGARYGFSLPISIEESYQIQESEDVDQIESVIMEAEERGMINLEQALIALNVNRFDMVDLTLRDLSNSASCEFAMLIES